MGCDSQTGQLVRNRRRPHRRGCCKSGSVGHRFCQRYGYCSGMLPRWRTGRTEEEINSKKIEKEKRQILQNRVEFGAY